MSRNRARCLLCGETVESKTRHDYVQCTCGNIAVDGGHDYERRVWRSPEWVDVKDDGTEVRWSWEQPKQQAHEK